MIKLLEDDGWYLVRFRGSHRHYRHPTKPGTATMAGKPSETLRPMTEKSILRQAGIGEDPAVSGYVVVIEGDEAGGFSAWSPDLLGCVAAAATYEECVALMRDAIAGHLEIMREHGDPIPVPSEINTFTVVAA